MPTDAERREVARRLRELRPGACFNDVYEALGAYGPNPYESRCLSATGFARHLADLIEPETSDAERSANVRDATRTFGTDVERSSFDRDALLALADEMDEAAKRRRAAGHRGIAMFDEERARRIREALGEETK